MGACAGVDIRERDNAHRTALSGVGLWEYRRR